MFSGRCVRLLISGSEVRILVGAPLFPINYRYLQARCFFRSSLYFARVRTVSVRGAPARAVFRAQGNEMKRRKEREKERFDSKSSQVRLWPSYFHLRRRSVIRSYGREGEREKMLCVCVPPVADHPVRNGGCQCFGRSAVLSGVGQWELHAETDIQPETVCL